MSNVYEGDRIPCKSEGCKATILPSTAEKTGGICMKCFQAKQRREYEEYIRKNRRDINLYEGVNDQVEVLKIMKARRKNDPLINYIKYPKSEEEIYSSLTDGDIDRLKEYVRELFGSGDMDTAEDILLKLVCFTFADIDEFLELMIGRKQYYPGIIFKGASEKVRDFLIKEVELTKDKHNHLLTALSWIGDPKVVKLFKTWHGKPPKWRDKLYVPPENYSYEAGWELTPEGSRENLFYEKCYPFEKRDGKRAEPVYILENKDEKCPWCEMKLTTLFNLDLTNPVFEFLDIKGERLKVSTCHICTCYGTIYGRFDTNGGSGWYEFNEVPPYLPDIPEPEEERLAADIPLALSGKPRSSYHAASWLSGASTSQIGGHPTWVQDAAYPICPECGKTMKFLGQLDCEDFQKYGEGIYYTFVCKECGISATSYQQT